MTGAGRVIARAVQDLRAADVTLFARSGIDRVEVLAQGGTPHTPDHARAALRHRIAATHAIRLGAPLVRTLDEPNAHEGAVTVAAMPARTRDAVVGALVVTVDRRLSFAERRHLGRLALDASAALHAHVTRATARVRPRTPSGTGEDARSGAG